MTNTKPSEPQAPILVGEMDELRKSLGLSIYKLTNQLNDYLPEEKEVSPHTVTYWIRPDTNASPSGESLIAIQKWLAANEHIKD